MEAWPEKVRENAGVLNETEKGVVGILLTLGQHHLFAAWDPPGTNDEGKHHMLAQVSQLNETCAGGLTGYISRARTLLAAARTGDNPFQGWVPSIPTGIKLEPFTPEYTQYETSGAAELGHCGFILVAGGLGERLGYSGIKIELPVETITRTCYLQHYIEQILAIQTFYAVPGSQLPLAIMVSEDTEAKTVDLLERHANFGMARGQITLLKQGKVPALISNQAQMALAGPYEIEAKPHGHGDVHSLMHSTGTARAWAAQGIRWVTFFQDTNGLSFYTLPAMLGVSLGLGLDVNSLAIPRIAKQAIGAITRLVHAATKREMTVNVEYNQLDPLLRATIAPTAGDTNDPVTGHSPLPGNINQLLFRLEPYLAVLQETEGVMPEFVNPKYQDSTRTAFKKPTRLECMMQDYPRLLHSEDGVSSKVGFTMAPAWLCYSPCKNNPTDAAASIAQGIPAASPYTAESDQYQVWVRLLRLLGADISDAESLSVLGITATPGPRLVVKPSCAIFPLEVRKQLVRDGKHISITARSTLVVEGDVVLDSLVLDGSLQIVAAPYTKIIVRTADTAVVNRGHRLRYLSPSNATGSNQVNEIDAMRGYLLEPLEVKEVRSEPGTAGDLRVYIFNGHHLVRCEEAVAADTARGLRSLEGVTAAASSASASASAVAAGDGWLSCLGIPC